MSRPCPHSSYASAFPPHGAPIDSGAVTYVYAFDHKHRRPPMEMKDLLGGKGANLAEMTSVLRLPVPGGFTISTDACRAYLAGGWPKELDAEISAQVAKLEDRMGRRLGDPADPLLVSVRSGAKFSMPGMMETVLDVGLNDASVVGLAEQSGDARFAADSYRRLLQMFGTTVLGIDGSSFSDRMDATDELDSDELRAVIADFKAIIREHTGQDFPQDPREQLRAAIRAVFTSWNTPRAAFYRRQEQIPDDL